MVAEIKLVRDLMTVGVLTCTTSTPLVDLGQRLLDTDQEGFVVIDGEGHAVGVVTRDELVRAYARLDCCDLTAEDVMREGVPQVPPDIPLTAAAQMMQDQDARVVFLMHHADGIHYPAAQLSYTHLLRHLVAGDSTDLQDLGIKAARQTPLEMFFQRRDEARRRASHKPDKSPRNRS
jgi:CBS domain-containing protein